MSMLTPPGMGGKYRVTGAAYPRMKRPRRRRRVILATLGSTLTLSLLGYGTLQLVDVFQGDAPTEHRASAAGRKNCPEAGAPAHPEAPTGATRVRQAAAAAPTTPAAPALPAPSGITVNVFNATPRAGLAKSVGEELRKRGFVVGTVGNAPAAFDKKIPGVGILLGSPRTDKGVYTVLGTQLPGAKQQNDTREGREVDLILGTGFTALAGKEDAARALAALTRPAPAPSTTC
ncbi:LytR C-terminal domain-containing protein [Streptomyces sp. BI20]|uniref:LytR C-terminal domain-containing protein n=1 Tax=Streptomyces sp. BI20 TaxID=3403460 RepID=UPI003C77E90C